LYCLVSMYLSRLDFTFYQQVESLVSIPIALVSTPPFLCAFPSIQRLSCLDNGQGLPTL
jgi:hypothetical protein